MKAVVTGGAGFIGSHLVDVLIEKGFEVFIIDNLVGGRLENVNRKAIFFKEDIRNLEKVKEIVNGARYVFHLAALPRVQFSIKNPIETNEVNVNGTLNMLVIAKDAGVKKFIFSSSSSVYGNQKTMPLKEDMPVQPLSPYAQQKYIGELYCKMFSVVYSLPTISLRYFNVYGPRFDPEGDYALVIGKFLKQRKERKPLTIVPDGNQTRDFTHVKDVAMANILAMESGVENGEIINIGAGENCSINRLATIIGGPTVFCEPRLEPKHTLADISKVKKLLGWEPQISLEEGIEELKKIYL